MDDGEETRRVALFEPEPQSATTILHALRQAQLGPLCLPDPAIRLDMWHALRFDAAVINPFRSAQPPSAVMALMRTLAGDRPILALTPADASDQRVLAIVNGADDAIAATADVREMVVSLGALLRRRAMPANRLALDDLEIDLIGRHVRRAGQRIAMPLREFDLLTRLARSANHVVSRADLLRAVWRMDFDPGTNSVEVHMSRLRQRVDAGYSHAMLRTVKGAGYALVSQSAMAAIAPFAPFAPAAVA
ncbi:MAG: winged-helix domain-containing protein [Sphingopyxis sp.]